MSLRSLITLWNRFWFEPGSPTPIALYRILLGLVMLQDALLMRLPDWRLFYSVHAIIPVQAYISYWWGRDPRFDILTLLPENDYVRFGILCLYILMLFFMTIGFHTRKSALCALLINESLFNQFLLNLSGADVFLKLSLTLVAVSNAGDAFSIDNLRKTLKEDWRKTGFKPPLKPQWALRMLQVQVAYVYWITSLCKINEAKWVDGTALYYVVRYEDLARFSLPYLFHNMWTSKALTWFSLAFETLFPYLIWIKECRYFMILWGTLFHIGIDLTVNIPLFEWIFIGSYVCYIAPQDLSRVMDWIKICIRKLFGPAQIVRYSIYDLNQIKFAGVLHRLDIFGRLAIEPYSDLRPQKDRVAAFELTSNGKSFRGFVAFRRIALSVPLLWLLVPMLYIPGIAWISKRVFELFDKRSTHNSISSTTKAVGVS